MNIKEMLIYDLDKLTNGEIAELYKYIRRNYFAKLSNNIIAKLEERHIPNVNSSESVKKNKIED